MIIYEGIVLIVDHSGMSFVKTIALSAIGQKRIDKAMHAILSNAPPPKSCVDWGEVRMVRFRPKDDFVHFGLGWFHPL